MQVSELQSLLFRLVRTERWKALKREGSYAQLNHRWNCLKCKCTGTYCGELIKKHNKISAGAIRTRYESSNFLLRNSLCPECNDSKKPLDADGIQVVEWLTAYLERHDQFLAGNLDDTQKPSVLPNRKVKHRDRGSENSFFDIFPLYPIPFHSTEQLEIIPNPTEEMSNSENAAMNALLQAIESKVPVLPDTPLFQMPPELLLQPKEGLVSGLNPEFYEFFKRKLETPSELPEPVGHLKLNPRKFLLIESQFDAKECVTDLVEQWLCFVLFMFSQTQFCPNVNFESEPVFFEIQTLPTFTAQNCTTSDYISKMREYLDLLQTQVNSAAEDQINLEKILSEKLATEVTFLDLFHFLFDPLLQVRKESSLFAYYFFFFPKRLERILGVGLQQVLMSLDYRTLVPFVHSPILKIPPLNFKKIPTGFAFSRMKHTVI